MGTSVARVVRVPTRHGDAVVHLHEAAQPRAVLALGHGAGGGVEAPDLVAVTARAVDDGVTLALVEQPYRVAGRRAPPRAPTLDAAWTDVVAHLRRDPAAVDLPLVVGGRSSGARVACRTAAATAAVGVVCLAFPVRPPTRPGGTERPSRLPELDAVDVPVLVVQGARDPFGMPPPGPRRTVVTVAGDHALRGDLPAVSRAVGDWLAVLLGRWAAR
ncbi:alpha/beta family hydrolase [uncultured Cellulomonas sp.]|uniref:alpha/beta hydrolase family protein n=1 Tax=uncultured Cellulomonas sp. TaxID=189682 RepID=UPI00262CF165|nr:alpha/beta family hydrolase [uncultured Cellulomonas sp.]